MNARLPNERWTLEFPMSMPPGKMMPTFNQPRPTMAVAVQAMPQEGVQVIPLEFPCTCVSLGGAKDPACPHCKGKGVVLSRQGQVLLDFLKKWVPHDFFRAPHQPSPTPRE